MRRCGYCEAELVGKRADAVYCDDLCRRAAWAERTGYRAGNGRERLVQPRKSSRSGLQISYRQAVEVVTLELWAHLRTIGYDGTGEYPRARAERILAQALPTAQRLRLEARQ
jgi:hypothetical protein